MFIIELGYNASIEIIDKYLAAHRNWLQEQYEQGLLLCSGPKKPRDGGFIIALGKDRSKIEQMMQNDPFTLNQVSTYKITEFEPVKYHKNIENLL
jgi:uncharacterized protein YciI